MTIAADLLQRHIQTLVANNAQWRTLLADDVVWELPYAPALGHPGTTWLITNAGSRHKLETRPTG